MASKMIATAAFSLIVEGVTLSLEYIDLGILYTLQLFINEDRRYLNGSMIQVVVRFRAAESTSDVTTIIIQGE